jgi:hypothetical protein
MTNKLFSCRCEQAPEEAVTRPDDFDVIYSRDRLGRYYPILLPKVDDTVQIRNNNPKR